MDRAKEAVSSFLHKSGQKDTTVHETIAPAVTQEVVSPTRHENVSTAVDREEHQDHFHTSVQPVHHKEVLPEQHSHQMANVEERRFEHGDAKEVERLRAAEAAKYKDTRTVADTQHTQATAPTVEGVHQHHHVYETIQPVVQKETIQPQVVHTTVPVHEIHHNQAQHHSSSALPAVSMDEFKKQGGVLSGRDERHDSFPGEPKALSGFSSGTHGNTTSSGTTGTTGTSGLHSTSGTTGTGINDSTGHHSTSGSGITGTSASTSHGLTDSSATRSGTSGATSGLGTSGTSGHTSSGLGTSGTSGTTSSGLGTSGSTTSGVKQNIEAATSGRTPHGFPQTRTDGAHDLGPDGSRTN